MSEEWTHWRFKSRNAVVGRDDEGEFVEADFAIAELTALFQAELLKSPELKQGLVESAVPLLGVAAAAEAMRNASPEAVAEALQMEDPEEDPDGPS